MFVDRACFFFLIAVEVIRNNMAVRQQNDLRLYLDVVTHPSEVMHAPFYLFLYRFRFLIVCLVVNVCFCDFCHLA